MARRKIVDAHHHLWLLDRPGAYPWLQHDPDAEGMLGRLRPIASNYLPADYLADAVDYEVVKSVHIEAVPADPLGEARWLASLGGPVPAALVGFAALNSPDVERLLAGHAAIAGMRGVRQIVNWHPNRALTFTPSDLLADGAWQAGYALLGKYGLSFDAQLYAGQMDEMHRLAEKHPETLVILNHTGMPVDRDPEGIKRWQDGMARLASADNVVAKISGLGMVDHGWTVDSIRPFVLDVIEAFGTGRTMFGSNFPVDRLYSSFTRLYRAFEMIVADFTAEEQDRLFRANAERWYRL